MTIAVDWDVNLKPNKPTLMAKTWRASGISATYVLYMNVIYSPRARDRFNQVVEAKGFEGVFLCRKVC